MSPHPTPPPPPPPSRCGTNSLLLRSLSLSLSHSLTLYICMYVYIPTSFLGGFKCSHCEAPARLWIRSCGKGTGMWKGKASTHTLSLSLSLFFLPCFLFSLTHSLPPSLIHAHTHTLSLAPPCPDFVLRWMLLWVPIKPPNRKPPCVVRLRLRRVGHTSLLLFPCFSSPYLKTSLSVS